MEKLLESTLKAWRTFQIQLQKALVSSKRAPLDGHTLKGLMIMSWSAMTQPLVDQLYCKYGFRFIADRRVFFFCSLQLAFENGDPGRFTPFVVHPRTVHPFIIFFFTPTDDSTLPRFHPKTFHPWTFHPPESSPLGMFTPWNFHHRF